MKLAQITGEALHKMFDKELSKIPAGGANYFRRRKAFDSMAEKIKESNETGVKPHKKLVQFKDY